MNDKEKSELAPGKEPHLFINQLWDALRDVITERKSRGEPTLDLDDPRVRGPLLLAILAANLRGDREEARRNDRRWWNEVSRLAWGLTTHDLADNPDLRGRPRVRRP